MHTHLALLRGLNVGGHKKLPMADLRAFIAALGFTDARTLLQSGNLVFRSDPALKTFLETEAAKRLNLATTFLLRSAAEWREIIARNPFPAEAQSDPGHLLVMFFRDPPTTESLALLHAAALPSERIHPDGKHLYATFPQGVGDSKMAAVLLSPRFSKHASGRNWNTVLKLGALGR